MFSEKLTGRLQNLVLWPANRFTTVSDGGQTGTAVPLWDRREGQVATLDSSWAGSRRAVQTAYLSKVAT